MNCRTIRYAVAAAALAVVSFTQAQSFVPHYPAGVEGIKAATLPPPGIYFRDYNYIYFADRHNDGPPDFDLFAYVQVPRLLWITDVKVLGGYLGVDALVPFPYQDLDIGNGAFTDDQFGIGDAFAEVTLSWHGERYDAAVGYGVWMPTGDYDATDAVNSGQGYWGHMLTAGATWYFDEGKTWSISALNRYEINHENTVADITPGQSWTLEWGIGKNFRKTIDVGVIGYYQLQTTSDSGIGSLDDKDHVVGIGPEINMFCAKLGLFTSVRYAREFGAHNRPEGNAIVVTFTKRF